MTDERSFLDAILAEPDDDNVRAVYADWLDDQAAEAHQPVPCPRAEFIRVQIAIARALAEEPAGEHPVRCIGRRLGFHKESAFLAAFIGDRVCDCILCLQKRERELLGRHVEGEWGENAWEWFKEPYPWIQGRTTARGFIDSLACSAGDWLTYGDGILREQPVRRVTLRTRPNWMHRNGKVWLHDGDFECGAQRVCRNVSVGDKVHDLEKRITYLKGLFLAEWPRIEFEVPPERPVTREDFDAITRDILADCMSRWSMPAPLIEPLSIVFPRHV